MFLSFYLSIRVSFVFYLTMHLSIHPSIHPSVYLLINLSILCIDLLIPPPIHLSIYISIHRPCESAPQNLYRCENAAPATQSVLDQCCACCACHRPCRSAAPVRKLLLQASTSVPMGTAPDPRRRRRARGGSRFRGTRETRTGISL